MDYKKEERELNERFKNEALVGWDGCFYGYIERAFTPAYGWPARFEVYGVEPNAGILDERYEDHDRVTEDMIEENFLRHSGVRLTDDEAAAVKAVRELRTTPTSVDAEALAKKATARGFNPSYFYRKEIRDLNAKIQTAEENIKALFAKIGVDGTPKQEGYGTFAEDAADLLALHLKNKVDKARLKMEQDKWMEEKLKKAVKGGQR